jgi:Mg-chelatase subunit ChlD
MASIVQQPTIQRPNEHYCPISQAVMVDPVVAEDGNTYNREHIEGWFNTPRTIPLLSPLTGLPMGKGLVHNTALLKLIKDHKEEKKPAAKNMEPTVRHGAKAVWQMVDQLLLSVSVFPTTDPSGRAPVKLAVVVDTSYSMDNAATVKDEDGAVEANGLSLLDITKHSIVTLFSMLDTRDTVRLITYSTNSTVRGTWKMDAAGKQLARQTVESLRADGQTNFWQGLHTGMQYFMEDDAQVSSVGSVLIFTDGRPNVLPPRGTFLELAEKFKEGKHINFSINTFGFGNMLESDVLHDIACCFQGHFHYIPDPSFVGTIFINAISALLAKSALNIEVTVPYMNLTQVGRPVVESRHDHVAKWFDDRVQIMLGDCDKERTMLLRFAKNDTIGFPLKRISVKLTNCYTGLEEIIDVEPCPAASLCEHATIKEDAMRTSFVSVMYRAYKNESISPEDKQTMANFHTGHSDFMEAMMKDFKGEVSGAFKNLETWGKHYLLSLARTHQLQRRLNFADPGVQFYGHSPLFQTLQDEVEDNFNNKIPAPTPSLRKKTDTMPVYRSMGDSIIGTTRGFTGGCFEDGITVLKNEKEVPISCLKKGDVLVNGARVLCVTQQYHKSIELVPLHAQGNTLRITPWHPYKLSGKWNFPQESMGGAVKYWWKDVSVYNVVLDGGSSIKVNGIEVCTLGHGLTEDIVAHDFFGTDRVLNNLKQLYPSEYNKGRIDLSNCEFCRNGDGVVDGIRHLFP